MNSSINELTSYNKQSGNLIAGIQNKMFAFKEALRLQNLGYRSKNYLYSLSNKKIKKVNLPIGCFNAGIVENIKKTGYILLYRNSDEKTISGCELNPNLTVRKNTNFNFTTFTGSDTRLIWRNDNELLAFYSTISKDSKIEYIEACVVYNGEFINSKPFRISPLKLDRQKNWMPFKYNEEIYMIASVDPHVTYKVMFNNQMTYSKREFEIKWDCPWPIEEPLRGNTNCVRLNDGNYLTIFHTATRLNDKLYYDNGAYIFEGKPPFKVLKCSNKTIIRGEDATEVPIRDKHRHLFCTFPVGLVKRDNNIIISYGDNDSIVKIMKTPLNEILETMVDVI